MSPCGSSWFYSNALTFVLHGVNVKIAVNYLRRIFNWKSIAVRKWGPPPFSACTAKINRRFCIIYIVHNYSCSLLVFWCSNGVVCTYLLYRVCSFYWKINQLDLNLRFSTYEQIEIKVKLLKKENCIELYKRSSKSLKSLTKCLRKLANINEIFFWSSVVLMLQELIDENQI